MASYVSVDEVKRWLGIIDERLANKYSNEQIKMLIEMKMDYVDRLTNTKWNGREGTTVEYHDITQPKWGWTIYRLGYPVYLQKMFVKRLVKLEVFDGVGWYDLVQNGTEGRGKDYWVLYEKGIVYINKLLIPKGGDEIRVEYVYGRDDLPMQVKELTLLLVARDILVNDRRSFVLAEGASGVPIDKQIDRINERISELEEQLRAVHIGVFSTSFV